MVRRLMNFFVLSGLTLGAAHVHGDNKGATRHSWHVTGPFSMHYYLPVDGGDSTGPGAFAVTFSPEVLWFPLHGLGIGVEASIDYSVAATADLSLSAGPRIAYHLTRRDRLAPSGIRLMPFAGCSFQYVVDGVVNGATESGGRVKLGFGISPFIGSHGTLPVEVGLATERLTSTGAEGQVFTRTAGRIYLEVGFGAFLWPAE